MKFSRFFLLLLVPLFLSACGLSEQEKADYASVQRSGVSSAVYDKMVHGDNLSVYDIKALSRAGVSDGVTLRYLRNTGATYYLNSDDVAGLRKAGVSQSIVDYMLATPRTNTIPVVVGLGFGYGYGPYWGDPFWGGYPYGYGYRGYGYRHWH